MPASYFKPVGQEFINHYNRRFGVNWGPEWAGYSFAYFLYCAVGGHNNFSHPGFHRTGSVQLQVGVNFVMTV